MCLKDEKYVISCFFTQSVNTFFLKAFIYINMFVYMYLNFHPMLLYILLLCYNILIIWFDGRSVVLCKNCYMVLPTNASVMFRPIKWKLVSCLLILVTYLVINPNRANQMSNSAIVTAKKCWLF